jgi:hypothetical protein
MVKAVHMFKQHVSQGTHAFCTIFTWAHKAITAIWKCPLGLKFWNLETQHKNKLSYMTRVFITYLKVFITESSLYQFTRHYTYTSIMWKLLKNCKTGDHWEMTDFCFISSWKTKHDTKVLTRSICQDQLTLRTKALQSIILSVIWNCSHVIVKSCTQSTNSTKHNRNQNIIMLVWYATAYSSHQEPVKFVPQVSAGAVFWKTE